MNYSSGMSIARNLWRLVCGRQYAIISAVSQLLPAFWHGMLGLAEALLLILDIPLLSNYISFDCVGGL
jgi:hypothetical protein